jgi:GTP-binding protein
MRINTAQFIGGAIHAADYPKSPLPQVALAGRSNVGKSSLINCLVERKGLAKTSGTPGKTRMINFFSVNDALILVDLPGYGYARVSKEMRKSWAPMVEEYLTKARTLALVVIIVDVRRGPEEEEGSLFSWLTARGIPSLWVATKADKEKKTALQRRIAAIGEAVDAAPDGVIPFSARTKLGRDLLWSRIREAAGV